MIGFTTKRIEAVREHIARAARLTGEFLEDQWFDRTRKVRTSGDVSLSAAGITPEQAGDSEWYMPARPRHIRKALRAMPVEDVSAFTYVDLGCGKGRSLFVAAELPFRRIIGVELSAVLHGQAEANLRSFRPFRSGTKVRPRIEAVRQNAAEFAFPPGPLVLYMFNPFGAATMQRVLDHLDAARRRYPAHIIVILLWPQCAAQVAAMEGMQLLREAKQYQIFEAHPLGSSTAPASGEI